MKLSRYERMLTTRSHAAGLVFGTAGHIDHGKTALIRALTGIDTDRLEEEKRRGISIDLGFAYLDSSTGQRLSFVDVPGHERFIKNMLAGATGIDAVLLIVAANESVKPQTREHLDICRLLGVRHGVIVLTKCDLADLETKSLVTEDIRELCKGTFLENAALVRVSSHTREGLEQLKSSLFRLASTISPRTPAGLVRLPVDRAFSMAGFGAVVTGTLWSGQLQTGDVVEHFPSHRTLRIRGLEVHGRAVDVATAGQRTAVNLSGADHTTLHRGDVIAQAARLEESQVLDVSVEWLGDEFQMARQQEVFLHLGTAEILANLKALDPEARFARLRLTHPLLALPGDRFVLRRPSPARTIAGGSVIDTFPPSKLSKSKTLQRLHSLAQSDMRARISLLVEESKQGKPIADLVKATGLTEKQIQTLAGQTDSLQFSETARLVLSRLWILDKQKELLTWLRQFHSKNPAAAGASLLEARLGLEPPVAAAVMQSCAEIEMKGDLIALKSHKPAVDSRAQELLNELEKAFRQAGFQPPSPDEALRTTGASANNSRGALEQLIKQNKLVRISSDLVFHADVVQHIRHSLSAHKGRRFSIPEFKNWTNISRKYAIPLLEYLDRQHITRRDGDSRIVL